MRFFFYELLTIAMFAGALFFFVQCLSYLARRDYVSAVILMLIGMATIAVGKEMARLALVKKE